MSARGQVVEQHNQDEKDSCATRESVPMSTTKTENPRTRRAKHHFYTQKDAWIAEIDQLKAENDRLKKRGIEERKQIRDLKSDKTALQESLQEEERQHKEMRDKAKADYTEAEEALVAQLAAESFHTLPDNEIQDKLTQIRMRCEDWVHEWRIQEGPADVSKAWETVSPNYIDTTNPAITEFLGVQIKSKGLSGIKLLCLSIVLREFITCHFDNPFYLFQTSAKGVDDAKALRRVFKRLKQSKCFDMT